MRRLGAILFIFYTAKPNVNHSNIAWLGFKIRFLLSLRAIPPGGSTGNKTAISLSSGPLPYISTHVVDTIYSRLGAASNKVARTAIEGSSWRQPLIVAAATQTMGECWRIAARIRITLTFYIPCWRISPLLQICCICPLSISWQSLAIKMTN